MQLESMKQKVSNKNLIYYWRVWRQVVRSALKRGYLYKTDIFVRFVRTILVLVIQIVLLNTLFGSNTLYVGWSKSEAYLVIGIWNLLNYLGWSLFATNLLHLESNVIEGRFDYILLKPLLTSWYASFSDFFINNFVTALSGLALIGYYIFVEWHKISPINILFSCIAICIAFVLWYGIYLFFASFTISNPRNGYLSIAKELLGLTKYPINIFGEKLRIVLYTAIPIAFVTTVPANVMIGRGRTIYIFIALLISISVLILGNRLWRWNIKKYTSASS